MKLWLPAQLPCLSARLFSSDDEEVFTAIGGRWAWFVVVFATQGPEDAIFEFLPLDSIGDLIKKIPGVGSVADRVVTGVLGLIGDIAARVMNWIMGRFGRKTVEEIAKVARRDGAEAAMEFAEELGEEIGEEVGEELVEESLEEVAEEVAEEIAEEGAEELTEEVTEEMAAALNRSDGIYIYGSGGPGDNLAELDVTSVDRGIIIENKNGRGLTHPLSTQTPEQWANTQIYGAGRTKINAVINGVGTQPGVSGNVVPTIQDIQSIRHLEFQVLATEPAVVTAVETQIQRLQNEYHPTWTITVRFGVNE